MVSRWRFIFILVVTAFVLHFIWENSHVSLYGGYENLSPYLPITLWATLGDVFYTLLAFLALSLWKRSFEWCGKLGFRDYIAPAIAGFGISLFVEYKALALERWFYLPSMPIIPILNVGLSPVVQMTLLLPLSFYLAGRINRCFGGII